MCRLHRNQPGPANSAERVGRGLRGLTLVELIMAISITSMTSLVLGGLIVAVQIAGEHSEGFEAATSQAQAVFQRIRFIVSHAGVYQVAGQPTTPGLAVVKYRGLDGELPDVLVVWSGGRSGGMAALGTQTRLPRIDELVIYASDLDDSSRLVEIAVSGDGSEIDFRGAGFQSRILSLIASVEAQRVLLCDRIRSSTLTSSELGESSSVGVIRFELETTPSDSELETVAARSAEWYGLPWSQGIVASDSGLRQINVRMEIQVEPRPYKANGTATKTIAIPYFGSASYRYVHNP